MFRGVHLAETSPARCLVNKLDTNRHRVKKKGSVSNVTTCDNINFTAKFRFCIALTCKAVYKISKTCDPNASNYANKHWLS